MHTICRFLVVGNIFRLETCMNSLVKILPYSKWNFQGKIFFTQNWCNITLIHNKVYKITVKMSDTILLYEIDSNIYCCKNNNFCIPCANDNLNTFYQSLQLEPKKKKKKKYCIYPQIYAPPYIHNEENYIIYNI
jgi:hypothetical protein